MTPGQLTSRIVQAISSVQLFAQRCLLNLEPQVSVDVAQDDKWAEWDWRQKYRLWQANQKIWLYPENYVEPELRDDKTPFFVDLENELRQKEITPENAETAFLHYLEKLDNVARLLPCGTYHEHDTEDGEQVERLHVVARTDSTPHVYYYRTWVNRLRWTPWEKIDLDIEGGDGHAGGVEPAPAPVLGELHQEVGSAADHQHALGRQPHAGTSGLLGHAAQLEPVPQRQLATQENRQADLGHDKVSSRIPTRIYTSSGQRSIPLPATWSSGSGKTK